jgi:hypothetical protein
LTRVLTSATQAEDMAAEQERNREAWKLPRQPAGATFHASPGSPKAAPRDELAPSPLRTIVPELDINGADHHTTVQDGLDWQGFLSRYFPGRQRHDLEALTAYGAYRSSRVVDERLADDIARLEEPGSVGSTAVDAWEDEGGANSVLQESSRA